MNIFIKRIRTTTNTNAILPTKLKIVRSGNNNTKNIPTARGWDLNIFGYKRATHRTAAKFESVVIAVKTFEKPGDTE